MSEDSQKPHDHVVLAEPVRDIYLNLLLRVLDRDETKTSAVSMTLQVGGVVLVGELISRGRWEDEFRTWLSNVGGNADLLATMLDVVNQEVGEKEKQEDGPLHFLHLRNVQVVTNYQGTLDGPAAFGPERPLWRTRIVDVQGWCLGRPE